MKPLIEPSFRPSAVRKLRPDLTMQSEKDTAAAGSREKKKVPTYNLTAQQIEEMKKKASREAVEVAWTLMLGLPCMALLDKFGFSGEDLQRYMDEVMDYYDSYERGYISLKDVHDVVLEEAGYDIVEKRVEARHKPHPKKGPWRRTK